eukprot:3778076-Prorocentrum_lima.AAC.1
MAAPNIGRVLGMESLVRRAGSLRGQPRSRSSPRPTRWSRTCSSTSRLRNNRFQRVPSTL